MVKKRIITTIGPTSLNESVIRKMDKAGADIFRINLSHTKIEDFEPIVKKLKQWTDKIICPDTEGAQLRTAVLPKGPIEVSSHEILEFVPQNKALKHNQIPLNTDDPYSLLQEGDLLKIDFHAVVVQIVENKNFCLLGRVIQGGQIGVNKGISVDRDIVLPPFTNKDIEAFKISNTYGLKTVAFSFASHGDDVTQLRKYFNYDIEVISKVESKAGLLNLKSICQASDGVLIDRGDLSRDVPLEKIVFAQSYIIQEAKSLGTKVYVATNFMENMILNSQPTRAEIHDIVSTLEHGADGLVLAAETAIGKHPVECVRILSRTINEVFNKDRKNQINYLLDLPSDRIIAPHGGVLVQQYRTNLSEDEKKHMPQLLVDDDILSDVMQIAQGTYSPLQGFMNAETLNNVLDKNVLPNGVVWTLPILFQMDESGIKKIPSKGDVALCRLADKVCYAVMHIEKIEKMKDMKDISLRWFGTTDENHPGVKKFLSAGGYILSGKVFLVKRWHFSECPCYELTPRQTRQIFNDRGWHDVVGFHTRNVIHWGHEFIQRSALEKVHADAIFISPVVGRKKKGDFKGLTIIRCYEEMMRKGYYQPFGSLLGAFNTYSRYSGPREAVFTAICRKNFGCNYFIVGRDHTGVGDYYAKNASQKLLEQLDLGMKIIAFDPVYFCQECQKVQIDCKHEDKKRESISGTKIRDLLVGNQEIGSNLVRKEIADVLKGLYKISPETTIEL